MKTRGASQSTIRSTSMERRRTMIWPACKTSALLGRSAERWCGCPAFLSRDSLKDLGTLVILDHILTGERFAGASAHLSPVDRAQARSLLENQQSQLRQKLKLTLEGAYGIAPAAPGSIDPSCEATIESIPDEVELRQQALPPQSEWEQAQRRASAVFGYTGSPLLNASNVNRLSEEIKRKATEARSHCRQLVRQLADVGASFGVDGQANRSRTAGSAAALVEMLADASIDRVVSLLASATIATSESAVAASIAEAGRLAESLQSGNWDLFDALQRVTDERRIAAEAIRQRVTDALAADEYVVRFAPELRAAQSEAVKLLSQPTVAPPPPPTKPGRRRVESARAQDLDPGRAKDLFASLQKKLDESTRRRLTVDWIIEEEPPS
jgi:hypothetical protein